MNIGGSHGLALVLSLALGACGGGGGDSEDAGNSIPLPNQAFLDPFWKEK